MKEAGFTTRATSPISVAEGRISVDTNFEKPEVNLVFQCPDCRAEGSIDMTQLQDSRLVGNDIIGELLECQPAKHVFAVKVMER